jgi:hypothetical protein
MSDVTAGPLGGASYDNPPSILDTMRQEKGDADKVNPFGGGGAVGVIGTLVLVAALVAGALNLSPQEAQPGVSFSCRLASFEAPF